jgi:hypothetical protein
MPIEMKYHEEDRVIHYIATDPWTMDEMNKLTNEAKQIFDKATEPVFSLVDVTKAKLVPQGAMRGRSNPDFTHPKAAGLVIVGASVLVRTISGVVAKLANMDRIYFFEKSEDAWAFMRKKIAEREKQPTS